MIDGEKLYLLSFKLYRDFLKIYLNQYLASSLPTYIKFISDREIAYALSTFTEAHHTSSSLSFAYNNLQKAIRATQNVAEVMLLNFSRYKFNQFHFHNLLQDKLASQYFQGANIISYGMKAYVRVFQILDSIYNAQRKLKIFVTNQNYYEWLDNLELLNNAKAEIAPVRHNSDITQNADIIFIELHPNSVLST